MIFPFGETITVWTEHRSRLGDVTLSDEREVHGVVVAPRTDPAGDSYGPRVTVTAGRTLYVPPGSEITSEHRVRLADGTNWEVQGEPGRWASPLTGTYPGDEIQVQRVTG